MFFVKEKKENTRSSKKKDSLKKTRAPLRKRTRKKTRFLGRVRIFFRVLFFVGERLFS